MTLAQLKALAVIASQLSGLPIPLSMPLPTVYIESDKQVQEAFCDFANRGHCIEVYAFYRHDGNVIHIVNDPAPYTLNSILIHELTHWLEKGNGVNQHDACANERFAYIVEAEYIVRYQHTLEIQMPPDCKE